MDFKELREIAIAKADELTGETARSAQPNRGAWSQPIRKRAYHRALKRNEFWAVHIKMCRDATIEIMNEMFKPSPLLKMVGLAKSLEEPRSVFVKGIKIVEDKSLRPNEYYLINTDDFKKNS